MPLDDGCLLLPRLLPHASDLFGPGIESRDDLLLVCPSQPLSDGPADKPAGRCQYCVRDLLVRVCGTGALIVYQPVSPGRAGLWPALPKLLGLLRGVVLHAVKQVEQLLDCAHLGRAAATRAHRLLRGVSYRSILATPARWDKAQSREGTRPVCRSMCR